MKGRTDRISCLHKDYRGMSSTVHPRQWTGIISGEGQYEKGIIPPFEWEGTWMTLGQNTEYLCPLGTRGPNTGLIKSDHEHIHIIVRYNIIQNIISYDIVPYSHYRFTFS